MEISSHYYALLALCRMCGMKKDIAYKVAYASQFVDDAKINKIIFRDENLEDILVKDIHGKKILNNIATCHSYMKIKTLNYQAMINNTSAFHFVPGCIGKSFTKKMKCKKDSKIIKTCIMEGMNDCPEKLGMLLHIYADTFSHQGFSGLISKENDIKNIKHRNKIKKGLFEIIKNLMSSFKKDRFDKYFDKLMPAYGHGQAMHYPDIPYLEWGYEYDDSITFNEEEIKEATVNNKVRFRKAFEAIEKVLNIYLSKNESYMENKVYNIRELFYDILQKEEGTVKKIKTWKKFLIKNNLYKDSDAALQYDEEAWLEEVFADYDKKKYSKRIVDDAELRQNYKETSWYKFIESAKWYKEELLKRCKEKNLEIQI